jgi:hypothetical protein
MPFKIVDISIKISSSLDEMVGFFDSFNMKEVEAHKGFDLEGVFTTHMVSIGYGSIFTRLEEITEGANDNKDTHVKAKVVATTSKIVAKKKKQVTRDDANTRASSNICAKKVPLQEESKQP